jgi:hypothetical protein
VGLRHLRQRKGVTVVQPIDSTSSPLDSTTQHVYASLLADAVRVLTAAARLRWPASGIAGEGGGEPVDWAEFVTLALAGAAANLGHIEAVLAGRPGSWEAEGVRQLLRSTVGDDDQLSRHRTEPVVVDVYVDEILAEMTGAWTEYDRAAAELDRRDQALTVTMSEPPTPEQERELDAMGELYDRLEEQRMSDWTAYGEALRNHIEGAAARTELTIPVVINVNTDTFRPYAERGSCSEFVTLGSDWVDEAVLATPLPGNGVEPLERLERPAGPAELEAL